jgi:hypothetical protein
MQTSILAFLGIASLLAGFIFRLVMPGSRYYAWAILAIGAVLIAAGVVLDFRRVRGALVSKRGKSGLGTSVKISLFSAIIILANAVNVSVNHRFDFTGLSQFTLTTQTKDVLADLDEPVEIVSFFTPSIAPTISGYARDLLSEYKNYSDLLTTREIDPELNPDQARQYQVNQLGAVYGVIAFRSEEGQRDVYGPQIEVEAEHAFTSAILEVTGTIQKVVYFITGHGESDILGEYNSARSGLRDNLFQVGQLDLLRIESIPDDAAALIMAGPTENLVANEVEMLRAYLEEGGRLFVLLNPDPPQRLREFLADWQIDIQDGVVIDPSSYVAPNKDTPLVPRTGNNMGLTEVYFPGAASLLPVLDPEGGLEIVPLLWTSEDAWLERTALSEEDPEFDESTDREGVAAIGVLISKIPPEDDPAAKTARIVVIGDSDFAANQHFQNGNNSDLFLSSVSWLTQGEEIISVDRKVLPIRRLILDPEEERFLHISSIAMLPLLLLLAGGAIWWRRRK